MDSIKQHIEEVIGEYKELFAEEYNLFCNAMIDKKNLQNNDTASFGKDQQLQQFVHEIPLTLHEMFKSMLTEDEMTFYKTKEGAEWFGRHFSEFSPTNKI